MSFHDHTEYRSSVFSKSFSVSESTIMQLVIGRVDLTKDAGSRCQGSLPPCPLRCRVLSTTSSGRGILESEKLSMSRLRMSDRCSSSRSNFRLETDCDRCGGESRSERAAAGTHLVLDLDLRAQHRGEVVGAPDHHRHERHAVREHMQPAAAPWSHAVSRKSDLLLLDSSTRGDEVSLNTRLRSRSRDEEEGRHRGMPNKWRERSTTYFPCSRTAFKSRA